MTDTYTAREDDQQEALFEWRDTMAGLYPELELLMHTANEGKRSASYGAKLKRMGLAKGFPDCTLFVPRHGYHGFVFELKRDRTCKASPRQRRWLERLAEQGYAVAVFYDWADAAKAIEAYLRQKNDTSDG
ncbi:MAG: VRR-NUC domain-containing protein [Oscillospiraceae bacterium]